jgi:hypothetical protein
VPSTRFEEGLQGPGHAQVCLGHIVFILPNVCREEEIACCIRFVKVVDVFSIRCSLFQYMERQRQRHTWYKVGSSLTTYCYCLRLACQKIPYRYGTRDRTPAQPRRQFDVRCREPSHFDVRIRTQVGMVDGSASQKRKCERDRLPLRLPSRILPNNLLD